jgi:DNA mismatch repair ATPase MutS
MKSNLKGKIVRLFEVQNNNADRVYLSLSLSNGDFKTVTIIDDVVHSSTLLLLFQLIPKDTTLWIGLENMFTNLRLFALQFGYRLSVSNEDNFDSLLKSSKTDSEVFQSLGSHVMKVLPLHNLTVQKISSCKQVKDRASNFFTLDARTVQNLKYHIHTHNMTPSIQGGQFLQLWLSYDEEYSTSGSKQLLNYVAFHPLRDFVYLNLRVEALGEILKNRGKYNELRLKLNLVPDEIETRVSALSKYDKKKRKTRKEFHASFSLSDLIRISNFLKISAVVRSVLQEYQSRVLVELFKCFNHKSVLRLTEKLTKTLEEDLLTTTGDIRQVFAIKSCIDAGFDSSRSALCALSESCYELLNQIKANSCARNLRLLYSHAFGFHFAITFQDFQKIKKSLKNLVILNAKWKIGKPKNNCFQSELFVKSANVYFTCNELSRLNIKFRSLLHENVMQSTLILNDLKNLSMTDFRITLKLLGSYLVMDTLSALSQIQVHNTMFNSKFSFYGPVILKNTAASLQISKTARQFHSFKKNAHMNQCEFPLFCYYTSSMFPFLLILGDNSRSEMNSSLLISDILTAHMGCKISGNFFSSTFFDCLYAHVENRDSFQKNLSTFMWEICELQSILSNLTSRSILFLDELLQSTSFHESSSIIWATSEKLLQYGLKTSLSTCTGSISEFGQIYSGVHTIQSYRSESYSRGVFSGKYLSFSMFDIGIIGKLPRKNLTRSWNIAKKIKRLHLTRMSFKFKTATVTLSARYSNLCAFLSEKILYNLRYKTELTEMRKLLTSVQIQLKMLCSSDRRKKL